jgi:hypothetical protein
MKNKLVYMFLVCFLIISSCQRDRRVAKVSSSTQLSFVTEVNVKDITDTRATICWITNELSTSEVFYGTSAKSYTNTSGEDCTFVTTHTIRLVNLQPQTKYFFKVVSRTTSGEKIESDEGVFITKKQFVNNPPTTPAKPFGPNVGAKNYPAEFYTSAIDPDGDLVRFIFDWGDGQTTTTEYVYSGDLIVSSHSWQEPGTYRIKVKAEDDSGSISNESDSTEIVVFEKIDPPNIPDMPGGPSVGFKGVSYSFFTITDEPNNYKIKYVFDWGDNTITETQFFEPRKNIYAQHKWDVTGEYYVKVKAVNVYGISSSWSIPAMIRVTYFGQIIQYGFEKGIDGWRIQNLAGNKGVTGIEWTEETARSGNRSMKVYVNLIPSSSDNTKGEVWIDMRYYPPDGFQDINFPMNMENKRIVCWIKAPPEAFGEETHANGVQIFVKDANWYSRYSEFTIIQPTNEWFKVTDVVNKETPYRGFCDNNFDPKKVQVLGIKIGLGEQSQTPYQGYIYVDDIYFLEE